MTNCNSCGNEQPVIRISNGDGTFTFLPLVDNIYTIPPDAEIPFQPVAGQGIMISEGGDLGHGPTISICAGEGLEFDEDGCLSSGSPTWTSPNITAPTGGILVTPGGAQGHDPTFAVAVSAESDNVTIDENGELLIECCDDIPWQGIAGTGISVLSGDSADGETGNGHRPTISVLVDDTTITTNDDGQLVSLAGGGVTDVCAVLDALPDLPVAVTVADTIVIGDDGNCYKAPPATGCIVTADATGDPWNDTNANWIDPNTIDAYCELRLDNGVTGSEIWRRLQDTNGDPQWQQVA